MGKGKIMNELEEKYTTMLKERLSHLDLCWGMIDVILAIIAGCNHEMAEFMRGKEPQVRKAVGVNCELFWITGNEDDPLSCVSHSRGFTSLPEAMREYEKLDPSMNPDVVDVVLRQCVATQSKVGAYYMLKPRLDQKRNLVVDTAEDSPE
jgi:hypothetical protein